MTRSSVERVFEPAASRTGDWGFRRAARLLAAGLQTAEAATPATGMT